MASDGGVVTWAGWRNNGGGLVVAIDHGNGIHTVYNHLGTIFVGPGQAVGKGQAIAAVGCTGLCTGPHVHFEVIVGAWWSTRSATCKAHHADRPAAGERPGPVGMIGCRCSLTARGSWWPPVPAATDPPPFDARRTCRAVAPTAGMAATAAMSPWSSTPA